MSEKILVPVLGESITEATVSKWLKKEGDLVEADEPIVELETDKVNLEVPSPVSGTLTNINSQNGSTVQVGALLGSVSGNGSEIIKKEEIKKDEPEIEENNVIKLEPLKDEPEIFAAPPCSDTEPNNAPTSTTEPSCELISVNTPEIGDGTSKFTLSVSSSTIGSSASTASPGFFNHLATVASVILSPRTGTIIFSLIIIN